MLPYRAGTGRHRLFYEVMSWVMGFGRQAEDLDPPHLRQAVAEELAVTAGKYAESGESEYQEDRLDESTPVHG